MQSPFDSSALKKIRDDVFQDEAEGYLITDISRIKAKFEGQIQQLNTREMKLDTLGVFPLGKSSVPLLEKSLKFEGETLTINALFRKSQIPIYSDKAGKLAYIPAEGANICRYFFELWQPLAADWQQDETEPVSDATHPIIAGFAILASYAGL